MVQLLLIGLGGRVLRVVDAKVAKLVTVNQFIEKAMVHQGEVLQVGDTAPPSIKSFVEVMSTWPPSPLRQQVAELMHEHLKIPDPVCDLIQISVNNRQSEFSVNETLK